MPLQINGVKKTNGENAMKQDVDFYMGRPGTGVVSERKTARDFDHFITSSGFFTVLREVTGQYIDNPYFQPDGSRPRIDRILIPTDLAQAQGVTLGPIGVELKKKDNGPQGRAIKQAISYRAAKFTIAGEELQLSHVFFGPSRRLFNEIAAVMDNFRVGPLLVTDYPGKGHESYRFHVGQSQLLTVFYSGYTGEFTLTFKPEVLRHGGRFGSK